MQTRPLLRRARIVGAVLVAAIVTNCALMAALPTAPSSAQINEQVTVGPSLQTELNVDSRSRMDNGNDLVNMHLSVSMNLPPDLADRDTFAGYREFEVLLEFPEGRIDAVAVSGMDLDSGFAFCGIGLDSCEVSSDLVEPGSVINVNLVLLVRCQDPLVVTSVVSGRPDGRPNLQERRLTASSPASFFDCDEDDNAPGPVNLFPTPITLPPGTGIIVGGFQATNSGAAALDLHDAVWTLNPVEVTADGDGVFVGEPIAPSEVLDRLDIVVDIDGDGVRSDGDLTIGTWVPGDGTTADAITTTPLSAELPAGAAVDVILEAHAAADQTGPDESALLAPAGAAGPLAAMALLWFVGWDLKRQRTESTRRHSPGLPVLAGAMVVGLTMSSCGIAGTGVPPADRRVFVIQVEELLGELEGLPLDLLSNGPTRSEPFARTLNQDWDQDG